MSNGESKIAIFKAALCCGFAIALRALFLGIRRCDFSRTHFVIASECNERGNQRARNPKENLDTVDCFAYARNDTRLSLRIIFASLRAHARERGNQQCRVTNTFDCNANARNNAKCANLKHLLLLCGVWHKIALDSEIL